MRVADFHFDLPEELIAQHPPAVRGASRMLVLSREQETGNREQGAGNREQARLVDAMFRELPEYLRAGDLLVLNDSRVLPARLFAARAGRAETIEVLLVEEVEGREQGIGNREQGIGVVWRALVKPAKKARVGERLEFRGVDRAVVLTADVVGAGEFGERMLRFEHPSEQTPGNPLPAEGFYEVVGRIGHMPLPPYIRREQAREADSEEDRERYQTVYSGTVGSAAAPTAGLHFTAEVLEALRAKGVEIAYVTLHVGLGTFQPVRVSELKDIKLHSERYTLPAAAAEALNRALADGRRVVAVGTTTTRVLEHVAGELQANGRFEAHSGTTSIFIGPGHRFRVVGGLLTNFHLPESTLLMLVSALAGREQVLAAYAHAVRGGYRFYSYGDCMLVTL